MIENDTALVVSSGGLAGSTSAGFVHTISKKIGIEHFSTIYCYSVGVYTGTFAVANQFEEIEKFWRNKVDGKKVVNIYNAFTFGNKKIINLKYLKEMFSKGEYKLDVEKALSSKTKLEYVLIEHDTGEVKFVNPKKENIFELMTAACAIPVAYGPYAVDGTKYLDVNFVSGIHEGIERIVDKHEKTVFVSNFPIDYTKYTNNQMEKFMTKYVFPIFARLYPKPCQEKFKIRYENMKKEAEYLQSHPDITLIAPRKKILRSAKDTNKKRLNEAFDEGVKLAEEYIKNNVTSSDF